MQRFQGSELKRESKFRRLCHHSCRRGRLGGWGETGRFPDLPHTRLAVLRGFPLPGRGFSARSGTPDEPRGPRGFAQRLCGREPGAQRGPGGARGKVGCPRFSSAIGGAPSYRVFPLPRAVQARSRPSPCPRQVMGTSGSANSPPPLSSRILVSMTNRGNVRQERGRRERKTRTQ